MEGVKAEAERAARAQGEALGYSGLSYAYTGSFDLGDFPSLPTLSFNVSVTVPVIVPAATVILRVACRMIWEYPRKAELTSRLSVPAAGGSPEPTVPEPAVEELSAADVAAGYTDLSFA